MLARWLLARDVSYAGFGGDWHWVAAYNGRSMARAQIAMIDQVPVPVADVRVGAMEGDVLLYHPRDTRAIYLNPSAAVIWSLCDGRRRIGKIIHLIEESDPEAKEKLTEEVFATLAQLRENGVLSAERR